MANNNAKLVAINTNKKELEEICQRAQKVLNDEHSINVSNALGIATIAYIFFDSMAQYLSENKDKNADVSINMMDMFELGVRYRESEDGEKEGNFTPFIQTGQRLRTIVKDDEDTEEE